LFFCPFVGGPTFPSFFFSPWKTNFLRTVPGGRSPLLRSPCWQHLPLPDPHSPFRAVDRDPPFFFFPFFFPLSFLLTLGLVCVCFRTFPSQWISIYVFSPPPTPLCGSGRFHIVQICPYFPPPFKLPPTCPTHPCEWCCLRQVPGALTGSLLSESVPPSFSPPPPGLSLLPRSTCSRQCAPFRVTKRKARIGQFRKSRASPTHCWGRGVFFLARVQALVLPFLKCAFHLNTQS